MGGSFNPPHEGHLLAAETACRRLRLDRLWWVVTPGNPLKPHGDLAPLAERLNACRRLIGSNRRMQVASFEAALGTPYTAASLAFLKRRFPRTRFAWIMGADNLAGFHHWHDWRTIFRLMPIAVLERPGWRHSGIASPAARAQERWRVPEQRAVTLLSRPLPAWTMLTMRLSTTSSTHLRNPPQK
jgi:nicotinate-nucleotide adenylyltransferase